MSVEIAWKQNSLVTDFYLLKSLLVVLGFGSQAFICGFSRQNICSVFTCTALGNYYTCIYLECTLYISHQCFYWQSILKQTASRPNHTSHRKVYFNEFVQNSLGCDMGIIIFDLHGYGGCLEAKNVIARAHFGTHPILPFLLTKRNKK